MANKGKGSKSPRLKGKKLAKAKSSGPQFLRHKALFAPMNVQVDGEDLPFFGHARAITTVCICANASPADLANTLDQLGVNGISFQQCVFGSVTSNGYSIAVDTIPDAPTSTLMSVVDVITNAPKA